MSDTAYAEKLQEFAGVVRPFDPAFADTLTAEAANFDKSHADGLVEDWVTRYVAADPYRKYHRFWWFAITAVYDGVVTLGEKTRAAFVAYAEGIDDLSKPPAEHQASLESIRDAQRAEVFGNVVAQVESLGERAGIRVRHNGLTRALERSVPNPPFTVDYLRRDVGNPGQAAAEGALVGTAAMPVIGTAIGGLIGWAGSHLLGDKPHEASVETQKAWIAHAATLVQDAIDECEGSAGEIVSAQVPYAGDDKPSEEEIDRLNRIFQHGRYFMPEGQG